MSEQFGNAVQLVAGAYVGVQTGNWALFASAVANTASTHEAQRRARHQANDARNAYLASLTDRLVMLDISPDAPRTIALGRVRTVEGVRRRWVSGTHKERLTMIVSFCSEPIDGYEGFYFDDTLLTLDASGWVTTPKYARVTRHTTTQEATAGAGGVVTAAHAPLAGSLVAWVLVSGGEDRWDALTASAVGTTVTTSASAGQTVRITYQWDETTYTARIRPYTGAPGQNVGADIGAETGGEIGSTDTFAGLAVAAVDLYFDPDIYPQGVPNITALLRGLRVRDPRTGTTAWSRNPALHARHLAQHPNVYDLDAGDWLDDDISTAADACDVSRTLTLRKADGSTSLVTLPAYACDVVLSLADDPARNMQLVLDAMAGREAWSGGLWRMRAGHVRAATGTLPQSWLMQRVEDSGQVSDEPVLELVNGVSRDRKLNRVTGSCIDPDQRYQSLPYPSIADPVRIAAEGEYTAQLDYPAVSHIAHAQHLASVAIRQSAAGLRGTMSCGLQALLLDVLDVRTLDLPDVGMPAAMGKQAEVIGLRWHPTEGVRVQWAEIADAIFEPLAELTGRDPAPNATLPSITETEALTISAVSSGTAPLTDGSILTRTRVDWSAATLQPVRQGGQVELQYAEAGAAGAGDWPSWTEAGSATSATIPGLRAGQWYVFRVRVVRAGGQVRGPWSVQVAHRIATPPMGAIEAAQAAADAAQADADAANAALSAFANDDVLTPGEKPGVIQQVAVITAEQAGIDAQAADYSVSSAAYDAAVVALASYLATLTAPTAWDSLAGATNIDGATLQARFVAVYTARQALLDAVALAAKARLGALATRNTVDTVHIADGAVTQIYAAQSALQTDAAIYAATGIHPDPALHVFGLYSLIDFTLTETCTVVLSISGQMSHGGVSSGTAYLFGDTSARIVSASGVQAETTSGVLDRLTADPLRRSFATSCVALLPAGRYIAGVRQIVGGVPPFGAPYTYEQPIMITDPLPVARVEVIRR